MWANPFYLPVIQPNRLRHALLCVQLEHDRLSELSGENRAAGFQPRAVQCLPHVTPKEAQRALQQPFRVGRWIRRWPRDSARLLLRREHWVAINRFARLSTNEVT